MKVDVLALGMLTCMKKSFDLLSEHKGVTLDLATIGRGSAHLSSSSCVKREALADLPSFGEQS
jgi:hypothetical protein